LIRLTCSTPDRLRLDVAREISPGDEPHPVGVRLLAGGATYDLKAGPRTTLPVSKIDYDLSTGDVPLSTLTGAGEVMAVSAFGAAAASIDSPVKLSTAGLGPAVAKLMPLCGGAPGTVKADAPVSSNP